MTCRQCGATIADKALICYKCGTATTEAKYQPVPIPARSSRLRPLLLVLLAALVLLGLYAVLH